MTHSPGPWRLAKSGQIVDVNNRAIARIWNTSKRDQDKANGELIADAPEVRRLYDELCNDMAHLAGEYSDLREALALCVRAIDNLLPGATHIPVDPWADQPGADDCTPLGGGRMKSRSGLTDPEAASLLEELKSFNL